MDGFARVEFRWGNETTVPNHQTFDAIFIPFLLDLFTEQRLATSIMPQLAASLAVEGKWLFIDFVPSPHGWHRLLVKVMYSFFQKVCGIQDTQLPDYAALFAQFSLQKLDVQLFLNQRVETSVWIKRQ